VRDIAECLEDLDMAAASAGIDKVFVADGDALGMPMDHWLPILERARRRFPALRRVSCYATASNVREKTDDELRSLREHGLSLLYIGPESGDDRTLKRIAKGASFADHVDAARRAHQAGMAISAIALLGIAGTERSQDHARATAELITAMDPEFFAALTTTVIPSTPLHKLQTTERFELPAVPVMLAELRTIVDQARPSDALFRVNHSSNYLNLSGRLPRDRDRFLATIDSALALRPEWARGL
jgi:radical SAM superfamily enzyme YgiQ (UPF0313 family)